VKSGVEESKKLWYTERKRIKNLSFKLARRPRIGNDEEDAVGLIVEDET